NEFGFDYLRDNMKYSLDDYVQRPLNFAIIDEVDSILIDEARTPLIISGQADSSPAQYRHVNDIIPYLRKDEDYLVDEENRSVTLTDQGIESVERRLKIENLYAPENLDMVHHVSKALQAHTLYKRDEQYIVKGGEVVIVDEFTGRQMPGRRWSDGLHQAVEAKEGVEIKNESETLATVTFQNFFRMYDKLSGMTGTAETEAEEFHSTYGLNTVVIPTNRPIARLDMDDVIYRSYREKFHAIVQQIEKCHEKGQPILVGTTSVEKSEAISQILNKKGIEHHVLNAKYHSQEATIVAQAGRLGSVTIATNMAGRGTDIVLGGNPEAMANELVGKPELPEGVSELDIEQYWSDEYRAVIEKFRDECGGEKEKVLAAGGLFILGTERHESRRIDNQLRGRAGRQGDPGASRFFLSLEDDLLRLFGADRIAKVMDTLKMEEGVPIEAPMVTRSIESAQRKVEGRNFEIRKNLLEYDDVMDLQRKTIYGLRKNVLRGVDAEGKSLALMALDLFEDVAVGIINEFAPRIQRPEDWDLEKLAQALHQTFGLDFDFSECHGRDSIEMYVWGEISQNFRKKREAFDELEDEQKSSDKEAAEQFGITFASDEGSDEDAPDLSLFEEQIRNQYLRSIDRNWRGHLQGMEQMRDSIGLQGYAQKDPKKEYKKRGFELFQDMMLVIKTSVVEFISRSEGESLSSLLPAPTSRPSNIQFNRDGVQTEGERAAQAQAEAEPDVPLELPRVGRNDPCPCGSGKKYKSCHMRSKSSKDNPRRKSVSTT
ncbi:MAG: preprotein translocase subunit SecA, partial [Myxococcota bacterium]|nr:preprotein translocase subunit SecA [Myxococcota bacterium]